MGKLTTIVTSSVTLILLAGHHHFFLDDTTSILSSKDRDSTLSNASILKEASTKPKFHTLDQSNNDVDTIDITMGRVSIDEITSVPYIHCGKFYSGKNNEPQPKELLLLHGAKYKKETWLESNILPTFCSLDPTLSVVAVDLSVKASGQELTKLFTGLKNEKILSGKPLTILSPSASGRSVLDLLEASTKDTRAVTQIMKGWIPVACGGVTFASDHVLGQLSTLHIPTLAMYGNLDKTGKQVSEKLKEAGKSYVTVMDLNGGHPVYLDDTSRFINYVSMFIDKKVHG